MEQGEQGCCSQGTRQIALPWTARRARDKDLRPAAAAAGSSQLAGTPSGNICHMWVYHDIPASLSVCEYPMFPAERQAASCQERVTARLACLHAIVGVGRRRHRSMVMSGEHARHAYSLTSRCPPLPAGPTGRSRRPALRQPASAPCCSRPWRRRTGWRWLAVDRADPGLSSSEFFRFRRTPIADNIRPRPTRGD